MGNTTIECVEQVAAFLEDLKRILCSQEFDCERDLDILSNKKTDSANPGYTTRETMIALDYVKKDVYNELVSLTEQDYYNTVLDDLDRSAPKFYAFGKAICGKEVYIKVKIRDRMKRKVFCVSFHFPRFPIVRPYNK